ncbi:hypothetical protein IWZ00DRAFT_256417 [Phyllosticta capitalensis]|uniref:Ribosomal protein L33 n=1 Tax=Phyllosticta capitalensis TaxID=121624 RepID=A0ABR1YVF4_9PEZI
MLKISGGLKWRFGICISLCLSLGAVKVGVTESTRELAEQMDVTILDSKECNQFKRARMKFICARLCAGSLHFRTIATPQKPARSQIVLRKPKKMYPEPNIMRSI